MTQVDLSKLIFHSSFSGFANDPKSPYILSLEVASQTVTGTYTKSGSISLTSGNSLTQVQAKLSGLDDRYFIFKGYLENFYTSSNVWTNNITNTAYSVVLNTGYTSSQFVLTVILYNLSLNNTVTVPAFTILCEVNMYGTPF